ncbi:acetate--CoA ligase family protein [Geochorda subterranea]|uniref:CoA-binding protein n=1 Tax=Geochorda subterranea TaxID=3109564 RepID=A0ABZ1BSQ7_9FIRM|nr:CoA-binding protein [Limnochorda sp. LNt]WRP15819.1 CoA-binding protein [Limnochorda sp. LNt]
MIRSLLTPRTVAIVGASPNPDKIGHIILRHLLKGRARVYPVHPHATRILDQPVWPSLDALPEPVDMAVLATPAATVPELVQACVRRGVEVVIPIAGGFGETGEEGRQLERRLRAIVQGSRTRILGPNTLGVLNPIYGLDTLFLPDDRLPRPGAGSVALLSQSGAVGATLLSTAASMGVGVSAFVGMGNRLDIAEAELLQALGRPEDPTAVIGLYLESFADGPAFLEAARQLAGRKPVVLLKAGRTATGARAAALHTGSMAGPDQVVDGVLRQYGIWRVFDDLELVDTCLALALAPAPAPGARRVAVVTCAGGQGVMLSDYIESTTRGVGLAMASFSEGTRARLREVLPSFASVANPVDLTGQASSAMYEQALQVVLEDPGVDAVLASVVLQLPFMGPEVLPAVARQARRYGKPVVAALVGVKDTQEPFRTLNGLGVPTYPSLWRAVRSLAAILRYPAVAAAVARPADRPMVPR